MGAVAGLYSRVAMPQTKMSAKDLATSVEDLVPLIILNSGHGIS
jgi:hypothetical protein